MLWRKSEIVFETKLANDVVAKIYERPVRFDAQTYDDMDCRKEWEGGCMVFEGATTMVTRPHSILSVQYRE